MTFNIIFEESKMNHLPTAYAEVEGKKIYIHSKYDPIREAQMWADQVYDKDKDIYVIFGVGLLYHVEELLKKVSEKVEVILIEPERMMVDFAIEEGRMKRISEYKNISFFLNFKITEIKEELNKHFLERNISNLAIASFPIYERLYPEYLKKIIEGIKQIIDKKEFYINTKERFSIEHAQNITANIYEMTKSTPVDVIANYFEGASAVLVSAGPSLEKNINLLKGREKDTLIITGGRTLKPLLDRGIRPHFVVAADPHIENYKLFKDVLDCGVPLLTMWICNKYIVNNYEGDKFFVNGTEIDGLDVEIFGKPIRTLYASGTVSTLQLDFARWIGCKNIAMIGQDLTDTGGKTHANIASHGEDNREIYRKSIKVKGNIEEYVFTHEVFKKYIDDFQWYLSQTKDEISVYNCTEGGAYIEGTTVSTLQEFLERFSGEPRDYISETKNLIEENKDYGYKNIKEVYRYLQDMQRAIVKTYKIAGEAIKIIERSIKNKYVEEKDMKKLNKIDKEIKGLEHYNKIANTLSVRTLDNLGKVRLDETKDETEQVVDILKFDRAVYSTMKGTCKAYSLILADVIKEYKDIIRN